MRLAKKREQLKSLRSEIIDKIFKERWEDVWFFPEYKGVKGYLGTQDIIFLSINPSTGVFPSWFDKQYYRQLKRNGFYNAHLTDVFKQRAKNWKVLAKDRNITEEAKRFLLKEIRIINPILIVLVGKSYERFYKKILKEIDIKAETVTISSYTFRYETKKRRRSRVRKAMRIIKKRYNKLSKNKINQKCSV